MLTTVLVLLILKIFSYTLLSSNKHGFFKFYTHYVISLFLLTFCCIFALPLLAIRPKHRNNVKIPIRIGKVICKLVGVTFELRNEEILAKNQAAVVMSNHQSYFDIYGAGYVWEAAGKMNIISKKENLYLFPIGLCAYLIGVRFIDRNNPKKSQEKLNRISKFMCNEKYKIFIFPEGTRNSDYTKLLPFKKGGFKMAIAAQVPIIPVVFSPYHFIDEKSYIFRNGHIILKCLEPVATEGLTLQEIPNLIHKVSNNMEQAYRELIKESSTISDGTTCKY